MQKKHVNEDKVIVSTALPKKLRDRITAEGKAIKALGGRKNSHYSSILENYIGLWNSGRLPRVYMGNPKSKADYTISIYMSSRLRTALKKIAVADGVSTSAVVRTAFAYHLAKQFDKPRNDIWASDAFLAKRPTIKL